MCNQLQSIMITIIIGPNPVADPGGVHRVQVNPPLPDIACVLFEFNTMLFTFKVCLGMLLKLAKAS